MDSTSMNEGLAANFLLVDVTMRAWSGKRTDKAASSELEHNKAALAGSARVIKDLMVGSRAELKAVVAAQSQIRSHVTLASLPWSSSKSGKNSGARLLASKTSMDFLKDYKTLYTQYESALNIFLSVYEDRRVEATLNLGQLANAGDYPSVEEMSGEFSVEINLNPVPATNDFSRLAIPADMVEALSQRLSKQYNVAVDNAMNDLHHRLVEQIGRIVTTTGKLARGENTNVRESLIGNLHDIVALLRTSNITNNSKLEDVAVRIDKELLVHNTKDLRASRDVTRAVSASASSIAMELDDVFF